MRRRARHRSEGRGIARTCLEFSAKPHRMGEAARSCDGKQILRLRIESSLFEQTFFWSWTLRSTQLIEFCTVRLSPSQSDRMSRTGGCALVTTDVFPNCVSVFSRKVEASLPGPCPGGPTCLTRLGSPCAVHLVA